MSDADAPSVVTVSTDGITVRKSLATDEFPVPAVSFEFTAEREDAAIVRLVDAAPDDVPPDDLGFNPDHGGEYWSLEDGYAVFERRIAPGEEYRTVYGVRNVDADVTGFASDPVLDVRTVDTPDESEERGHVGTTDDAAQPTRGGASGVGAALAMEIRNDDLSAADREVLATAFGRGRSEEARLSHLQSRISDLEAYSDALEAFIDDHGTGQEAIEDVTDRLNAIEAEVDGVAERADENATGIETLADRADENAAAIDEVVERTDETATDIDELDRDIADVRAEIEETQAWVDDLREDVAALDTWRTQISTAFGDDVGDEEDS